MGDWGTASDKHSTSSTTRLHTIAGVHAQVLHSHTQTEKLLNLLLVIPGISGLLGPLCEIMITLRPDQSFNSRSCAAKRSPDKDDKHSGEPMRAAGETGSKMVKDGQRWSMVKVCLDQRKVLKVLPHSKGAQGPRCIAVLSVLAKRSHRPPRDCC